jgi:hypothetical protein
MCFKSRKIVSKYFKYFGCRHYRRTLMQKRRRIVLLFSFALTYHTKLDAHSQAKSVTMRVNSVALIVQSGVFINFLDIKRQNTLLTPRFLAFILSPTFFQHRSSLFSHDGEIFVTKSGKICEFSSRCHFP